MILFHTQLYCSYWARLPRLMSCALWHSLSHFVDCFPLVDQPEACLWMFVCMYWNNYFHKHTVFYAFHINTYVHEHILISTRIYIRNTFVILFHSVSFHCDLFWNIYRLVANIKVKALFDMPLQIYKHTYLFMYVCTYIKMHTYICIYVPTTAHA